MSAALLWALLGLVFIGCMAALILRLQGAALGPYATRLVAIGAALATYFGALPFTHRIAALSRPVQLRPIVWAVPLIGGVAVLYCGWRVLQNWHSEVHGLLRGLLLLMLVVALAALARLCFGL